LSHSYIGTEHMGLGLVLAGEAIVAEALTGMAVSLDARSQIGISPRRPAGLGRRERVQL